MWLPLVHPKLGTWPATQACSLTGNSAIETGRKIKGKKIKGVKNKIWAGEITAGIWIFFLRLRNGWTIKKHQNKHTCITGKMLFPFSFFLQLPSKSTSLHCTPKWSKINMIFDNIYLTFLFFLCTSKSKSKTRCCKYSLILTF